MLESEMALGHMAAKSSAEWLHHNTRSRCLPVFLYPCLPVSLSPCPPVSLSPCIQIMRAYGHYTNAPPFGNDFPLEDGIT